MITQLSRTTADRSATYTPGDLGNFKSVYQIRAAFSFLLIVTSLGILAAAIIIRRRGTKAGIVLFKILVISLISYAM